MARFVWIMVLIEMATSEREAYLSYTTTEFPRDRNAN